MEEYDLHSEDNIYFLLFTGSYDVNDSYEWFSLENADKIDLQLESSDNINILVYYSLDTPQRDRGYKNERIVRFYINEKLLRLRKMRDDSPNVAVRGQRADLFPGNGGHFFEFRDVPRRGLELELGVQEVKFTVDSGSILARLAEFVRGINLYDPENFYIKTTIKERLIDEDPDRDSDGDNHTHQNLTPAEKIQNLASQRVETASGLQEKDATELKSSPQAKAVRVESVKIQGTDKIKLRLDPNLFLERKGLQSSLTKEGAAFTAFLKSRGYEIRTTTPLRSKGAEKIELILSRKEATFKEKRKIESLEAIYAFNKVASMLLTEPYFAGIL